MNQERRYRDDEILEIFGSAASPSPRERSADAASDGLTLQELQAIGREVGLPPERIAEAAAALELHRREPAGQGFLGMPMSVRKVTHLPRNLRDDEWELLVGELRATFGALGKEDSRGNLRQWTNGHLHVYLEPTETGSRLRLGTFKGSAAAINWLGISWIATAFIFVMMALATGELAGGLTSSIVFAGIGLSAFGYNLVRLPRWSRQRQAQMEYIAARAHRLAADPQTR